MNRKEGIPELNGRQPDRRAVQIAQEIHQDRAPLATILFGSRARGDHNEDRSDIDILIVEDNPPDELEQHRFQQKQKPRSLGAYGKEVRIHLVWATPAQIREDDIHINSLCTRAMLEGVTISETPGEIPQPVRFTGPARPPVLLVRLRGVPGGQPEQPEGDPAGDGPEGGELGDRRIHPGTPAVEPAEGSGS